MAPKKKTKAQIDEEKRNWFIYNII